MSDANKPVVPAWQLEAQADGQPRTAEEPIPEATLEQARKFLGDENVRGSSTEKKTEFLKRKGLTDGEIQQLLSEDAPPEPAAEALEVEQKPVTAAPQQSNTPTPSASTQFPSASKKDAPPIITYPEFLTHSPRPPPLLTPARLLNVLTVSSTAWTLLYGAARFVVGPMVENLNEARSDYYGHVDSKLSQLVEQLEGAVSEVPYTNGKLLRSESDDDSSSSYDDPTEMFHRDIGTQTSPQDAVTSLTTETVESAVDKQARQLARISSGLRELSVIYTKGAENSENLHGSLRDVRDDVDKMVWPPTTDYSALYGGRTVEPDDEYKKTKDAIRSVKGLFLSSKMFPAAAAR